MSRFPLHLAAALCLLLPALTAGAAPADAPWSVVDAPYRIPLRLKTAPEVPEAGVEINVPEFGQTRPDLGDLLLTDRAGTPQPLAKIGRRTGGRVILLAQKLEPKTPYFLYFGGGVHRPSPGWAPKTSLLMETRPAPDDLKFDSLAGLQAAWAKSPEAPGASFVSQIYHGSNPFGPNANFLTHYSGYLRVPQAREITFYTLSSDCSFVVVNDQEQFGWPGQHSPQTNPANVRKKAVACPAGLVKIDYYAAKGDVPPGGRLEAATVLGWQLPDHFETIPPEAWIHPGSAQTGPPYGTDGQPLPLPKASVISFLGFGGQWLYETQFELHQPQPAAGWTSTWKFEDGASVTGTAGTRLLSGKEAQLLQCSLTRNGSILNAPLLVVVPDHLRRTSVNDPADIARTLALIDAEPAAGLTADAVRARLVFICEYGSDQEIARLAAQWPDPPQNDPLWVPVRLALLRAHAQTAPAQAKQEFYALSQTLDPALRKIYADELGLAEMNLLVFCLRDAGAFGRLTQLAFQNASNNLSLVAKIRMGDLHRLLGHYKEAAAQYQNLGKKGPDTALPVKDSAASLAVRDLLERGYTREAQQKLAEWEQRRPMVKFDSDFLLLRARTLLAFGRWTEALAELESFQKVQPESPFQTDAQFYLARLRYEKGEKEEARKLWNAFAKDYPQHPLASQAKEWADKP
ncbi:MAG: tetratricopeptide repeat protein [Verrucomicrobiota bacterium]